MESAFPSPNITMVNQIWFLEKNLFCTCLSDEILKLDTIWNCNCNEQGNKNVDIIFKQSCRAVSDTTLPKIILMAYFLNVYDRYIKSPRLSTPPSNAYLWFSDFHNIFWFWKLKFHEVLKLLIFALEDPLKEEGKKTNQKGSAKYIVL